MASLSKAIIGVCVSELAREGGLSYQDCFADIVGRGPDVTSAALLSQASGLKSDSTQQIVLDGLDTAADRANAVLDQVIARGGPRKKPGRYRYNNENLALLSLVVEAAAGTSYQAACTSRALDPAGAKAQRRPRSGGFLAWASWQMSVHDYGAFMSHWFTRDLDPFEHPNGQVDGGVYYGLGMFFRSFRGQHNCWHHGALCFLDRLNAGSFAVSWMGEWSAVAAYAMCPSWAAMGSLDAVLSGAVFQ